MPALRDLTGQRFGRFMILERDYSIQKEKKSKDVFWKCECDCGNIFSARGHDIVQNKILSCGCLKKENTHNINYKDLNGKKFGHLEVLYKCDYLKDNHTVWHCKCDCGNEIEISGRRLTSGETQSCGCIKSTGELKLIQIFQNLNINFITQKVFEDCRNILPLKFDFYLPELNTIVEYNGKQHYKPIKIFGGQERYIKQVNNDNIKKEYCKNNNIKFIEIPYYDYYILNEIYIKNKLNIGD